MSNGASSKSQIFLMEFIFVIMFFALCAALCINAFVKADEISKKGNELNEALLLAESMAETIKSMEQPNGEQIDAAVNKMNKENHKYFIIKVKDKLFKDMVQADIYIYSGKGNNEEVCSLSVKKYIPSEVKNAD